MSEFKIGQKVKIKDEFKGQVKSSYQGETFVIYAIEPSSSVLNHGEIIVKMKYKEYTTAVYAKWIRPLRSTKEKPLTEIQWLDKVQKNFKDDHNPFD